MCIRDRLIGGNPMLGPDFGKLLFFNLTNYKEGDPAKTIADTTHSFNVGAFGLATSTNNDSDPFSAVQDLSLIHIYQVQTIQ